MMNEIQQSTKRRTQEREQALDISLITRHGEVLFPLLKMICDSHLRCAKYVLYASSSPKVPKFFAAREVLGPGGRLPALFLLSEAKRAGQRAPLCRNKVGTDAPLEALPAATRHPGSVALKKIRALQQESYSPRRDRTADIGLKRVLGPHHNRLDQG